MSVPLLACLAILGFIVGALVERAVCSYWTDGTFRLWSRGGNQFERLVVPSFATFASVSWLRRFRGCGRSPWVSAIPAQVVTIGAFVWVGARVPGSVPSLVLSLAEVGLLVVIFFIDIATHLIPTVLVGLLVVLALGAAALGFGPGFHSSVLGGALGFAGFSVLVVLARVRYGEGALGMGDANLALAIGCIIGYPLVVLTLCVGAVLGAITALFVLLGAHLGGHAERARRTAIPYAPFLICATVLSMAHVLIL